jgi:hypothetical protein
MRAECGHHDVGSVHRRRAVRRVLGTEYLFGRSGCTVETTWPASGRLCSALLRTLVTQLARGSEMLHGEGRHHAD